METTVQQIVDNAKQALEKLTGVKIHAVSFRARYKPENIERLKLAVCKAYNISLHDLARKSRYQNLVRPRQMFYYIAMERFGMTAMGASKIFNQDHTNSIHGRDKVRDFIDIEDPETLDKIRLINEYLK